MSAARVQALEGLLERVKSRKDGAKTRLMVARGDAAPVEEADLVEEASPAEEAVVEVVEEVPATVEESAEIAVTEVDVAEVDLDDVEVEEVVVEVDETPVPPQPKAEPEGPAKVEPAAKPVPPPMPAEPAAKAEPAVAEPEPAAKAEPAVAEPEPAVAEPEPAVAEPEPAVAEPEPAVAEPEPAAKAEPQPVAAEPKPAAESKPALAVAKADSMAEPVVSDEVVLEAPPAPAPASTLAATVSPLKVEPTVLKRDDVGDFIGEVGRMGDASFGAILEGTLELSFGGD